MEEKFLGFYNFVAAAKTRCSGERAGRKLSVTRPASITVEVPESDIPCCRGEI